MRIQAISNFNYATNNVNNLRTHKNKLNTNPAISFSGYYEVMSNVLNRNLTSRADVERATCDLYYSLVKENGIVKTPIQPMLSEWFACKGTYLIDELREPITKMRSEFRDIVFKSQDDRLPVIKKGNAYLLYIKNYGKHGAFNDLFQNQNATNNMWYVFTSELGTFEVGTNKQGRLLSEQNYFSGPWVKNTYNMYLGDRIAHKTGNTSDAVVFPF